MFGGLNGERGAVHLVSRFPRLACDFIFGRRNGCGYGALWCVPGSQVWRSGDAVVWAPNGTAVSSGATAEFVEYKRNSGGMAKVRTP